MRFAVAVLASVVSASFATPPLPLSAPRTDWLQPCVIGRLAAECGHVEVLESPDQPRGRRIQLRVVVARATSPTRQPDPVLFLAGGPGQGAAELADLLIGRIAFLRDMRDVVFVDQRGTGASNGLQCPPAAATHELFGGLFDPQRLTACRDRLATRADLTRYTTSASAWDYAQVLDALNVQQVNVWGVSYGTRLALELARRLPQRVRTLTLEAAVPTNFAWPTTGARDADAALDAVIRDCEADSECAATFPSFRRDVNRAFAALTKRTAAVAVIDPATGQRAQLEFSHSDLGYATRGMLYGPDAFRLPALFREAARGRYDAFAQAYVTRARTIGQELSTGVHLAVYCTEDLPFVDPAAAPQASQGTRLGTYLLDEYAKACAVWPRGTLPADFRDPVRSSVPTLVLAGRRDPVTPAWTAKEVAKTLTRARVVTWPAGGHGFEGIYARSCKPSIIGEFIATAQVDRLPVGCAGRERPLPFAAR